jgi:hypothetical protein
MLSLSAINCSGSCASGRIDKEDRESRVNSSHHKDVGQEMVRIRGIDFLSVDLAFGLAELENSRP